MLNAHELGSEDGAIELRLSCDRIAPGSHITVRGLDRARGIGGEALAEPSGDPQQSLDLDLPSAAPGEAGSVVRWLPTFGLLL